MEKMMEDYGEARNLKVLLREDRRREISERINQGMIIPNQNTYRYTSKIVLCNGDGNLPRDMEFGVEVTASEIFLYLIKDEANVYLSAKDLYSILLEIRTKDGLGLILDVFEEQQKQSVICLNPKKENDKKYKNYDYLLYRGIRYRIPRTIIPNHNGSFMMNDCQMYISYDELFALIHIIQEKSNAFWLEDNKYKNGLVRLLQALLQLENDNEILKNRGWHYKESENRFYYKVPQKEDNNKSIKYYLTMKEYRNIIKSKEFQHSSMTKK